MNPLWIPVFGKLIEIFSKVAPNAERAQEAAREVVSTLSASFEQQGSITKLDAESSDPFRSRWRPAIGWVCVIGFGIHFLILPIAHMVSVYTGGPDIVSPLDITELMTMLLALLGLGGYRTVERLRGKA